MAENQTYSYTFQAVDLDFGQTVVYGAPVLPSWLAFNGANTISGTPLAEHVGPHAVSVTAFDGTSTTTQSFQIDVINVDDPPRLAAQIAPDPQTAAQDEPYSFGVASFFIDPDGDELTFSASNLPPRLNIDGNTGVISGSPRGPRRGDAPSYAVTVTAANSGGSASDSFTLIIINRNDPPVIPDPPPILSTQEDESLDITPDTLEAKDEDPDDQMTVILTPPAPDAHFTLTNGGVTVQPEPDYNGPLQVEARVRDLAGAMSNTVMVTVNVAAINDAPRAKPIPAQTATEGSAFSLDLSAYFTDVENDPLSYQANGLPPGLAVNSATGVISGTPPVGTDAGDFNVHATVRDGAASSAAQFTTTLVRIGRADLAAGVTVAPNPSVIGNPATWTLTAQNNGQSDAANIALDAVFSGVPITFDAPSNSSCAATTAPDRTELACRLGPIAAGGSVSVTIAGRSAQAGVAHAAAEVSIVDPVPLDTAPENNRASVTLSVAERLSAGPAQRLVVADGRAGAAGDLNGDGFVDLAVATASNRGPVVFLNVVDPLNPAKRALAETAAQMGDAAAAAGIAIADMDGDGDLDVVTANPSGQANKVFTNAGNAAFTAAPLGGSTGASNAVALGDVDGDGRVDIVFANDNQSAVYLNRWPSFTRAQNIGGSMSRDAVLVNLFGNALPELVLANADTDARVYTNSGGTFQQSVSIPTGPTSSVAAADFDNDGDVDLVFGRSGTIGGATDAPSDLVYSNAGGAFSLIAELQGSSTVDVLTADVDLDGDQDIVSISPASGQRVYMNDGAGVFVLHAEQFVHAGATAGTIGLFSIDDRIDVAVIGTAAAGVFVNDGKGNLGPGDNGAPAVNLLGESSIAVTVGASYQDSGATAIDDIDGDLTDRIVVKNAVDTAVLGTYSVTYDVTDSSGNAATATRTVEVKPETSGGGGGGALGLELLALLLSAFSARAPLLNRRRRMLTTHRSLACAGLALALHGGLTAASELSYTFIDFEVLNHEVDVAGVQLPTPIQSVAVQAGDGDGISVGGGVGLPAGFYIGGRFTAATVDITATITNPLTVVTATDEFDLVTSTLAVGYQRELGETFDLIAELSRVTADYDFGSLAGENFDLDDSGIGARIGFRWNPRPELELFASARYSPVGRPLLTEGRFESDTLLNTGVRWYFFEDLGVGLDYEHGEVSTLTLAMRFSFGTLAW